MQTRHSSQWWHLWLWHTMNQTDVSLGFFPKFPLLIYLYYLLKLMPSEPRVNLLRISLTCRVSMLRFFSASLHLLWLCTCFPFLCWLANWKIKHEPGDLNPRLIGKQPANLSFGQQLLQSTIVQIYSIIFVPPLYISLPYLPFSRPKFYLSSLVLSFTFLYLPHDFPLNGALLHFFFFLFLVIRFFLFYIYNVKVFPFFLYNVSHIFIFFFYKSSQINF